MSSSSSAPPIRAGISDSIPSTGMPSARRSSSSRRAGLFSCARASTAARSRTSAVSSSSRQPGACSTSTGATDRWSATAKLRSSLTSSPQNSTRIGCSAVGGKMSTMPPRTANSPRAVTISTRVYASSTSRTSRSSKSCSSPTRSVTGSSRPRPGAIGWIRLRAAATTSRGAVAGSASARKIARRRPTVSGRGESRSCGRVSQLGSTTTASRPSRSAEAAPRSSASRSVAVTARAVLPPASRAERNGRSAAGPSTASADTPAERRSRAAAARAPRSGSVVASRPESLATVILADQRTQDGPLPGTGGGLPPGYARPILRRSAPCLPGRHVPTGVCPTGTVCHAPGRSGRAWAPDPSNDGRGWGVVGGGSSPPSTEGKLHGQPPHRPGLRRRGAASPPLRRRRPRLHPRPGGRGLRRVHPRDDHRAVRSPRPALDPDGALPRSNSPTCSSSSSPAGSTTRARWSTSATSRGRWAASRRRSTPTCPSCAPPSRRAGCRPASPTPSRPTATPGTPHPRHSSTGGCRCGRWPRTTSWSSTRTGSAPRWRTTPATTTTTSPTPGAGTSRTSAGARTPGCTRRRCTASRPTRRA